MPEYDTYVFALRSKNHDFFKVLDRDCLDDDSMTLEEAAQREFALFVECAPTCIGFPLVRLDVYGGYDSDHGKATLIKSHDFEEAHHA